MFKPALVAFAVVVPSLALSKEMYRAPSAGDSGTYFILSSEKTKDGELKVLTSRIGKGAAYTDFTELKIDCRSRQYFELAGRSEDGKQEKPTGPLKDWSARSHWTSLVPGSSKSDLVTYVCNGAK